MPEIFEKPKQEACYKYFLQYYPVTNLCFRREWDEISHCTRNELTFLILMLDLLITLIASIGILQAVGLGGGKVPDITDIFDNAVSAGLTLLIFLVVPFILIIVEFLFENLLNIGENENTSMALRIVSVLFFWFSIAFVFLMLAALLLGLGITNRQSTIQIAAIIWIVRLFINWIFYKPIIITLIYIIRKYVGKDREHNEDPKWCPGVLCCTC